MHYLIESLATLIGIAKWIGKIGAFCPGIGTDLSWRTRRAPILLPGAAIHNNLNQYLVQIGSMRAQCKIFDRRYPKRPPYSKLKSGIRCETSYIRKDRHRG
jgi:hypothetical protein